MSARVAVPLEVFDELPFPVVDVGFAAAEAEVDAAGVGFGAEGAPIAPALATVNETVVRHVIPFACAMRTRETGRPDPMLVG
jgi:hypothetical protein